MDFSINQIDINSANLNTPLEKDIYVKVPQGHPSYNKYFWKLNKALYRLKQSANAWNKNIDQTRTKLNFKRLYCDPCIYKKENKNKKLSCLLAVYIDHIIISETDDEINIYAVCSINPFISIICVKIASLTYYEYILPA